MRGIETGIVWGILGAVVLGLGLAVYRVQADPRAIVIRSDEGVGWIAASEPVTAEIRQWRQEKVVPVRFVTTFEAGPGGEAVALRFRALGEATVRLNDEEIFGGAEAVAAAADWKRVVRKQVGPLVRPGRNHLAVDVRNARGPGLLWLELAGRGAQLATGPHWRAARGDDRLRAAARADDTRPHASAHRTENALAAFAGQAGTLLVLFFAGAVGFLAWNRFGVAGADADFGRLAGVLVSVGWVLLFVVSFSRLPLAAGFDAGSHLEYLRLLWDEPGLPVATDGFAMYHPPLFYALAGGAGAASEWIGLSRGLGWKLVPFVSGLGLAWLAWGLARRVFPERPSLAATSLIFAGLLPMNLLLAAYFGNEGLHALLAAAALCVAVDALLRERLPLASLIFFSVLLGLALLAKFTAFLVAAIAGGALALRVAIAGGRNAPARIDGLSALVLPAVVIAGWFYARSFALYGTPVFGNWDLSGPGQTWWTQPGFHTAAYYLDFGTALTRPYLAGFASFWDALYSTTWGDGFFGGLGGPGARHGAWNYVLMATLYPLALPATALGVLGYVRGLVLVARDPDPRRRAALALLALLAAATLFAVFWLTLELPYFGQGKAFYGLFLAPAIGLYLAMGFDAFDRFLGERGGAAARALLYGWATAFFGAVFLAFLG